MSHTEAYVSCVVYKARDNNCCYTNISDLHACIVLHCPLCTFIISCPCVNQSTLNLGLFLSAAFQMPLLWKDR